MPDQTRHQPASPDPAAAVRARVPALTQYASPGLIEAINYRGHSHDDDPDWQVSGAPTLADYAFWAGRWCGMTCLAMALIARDGHAPTLWDLLQGALPYGAYTPREDGTVGGMYYEPFVRYTAEQHDLKAELITDLTPDRLRRELDTRLVIVSVHKEIRRPELPAPGRGGHLVLATGHQDGMVSFRNPSGHRPDTVSATLPAEVFDAFAAHRGIALHL